MKTNILLDSRIFMKGIFIPACICLCLVAGGCQRIIELDYHDIDPIPVLEATLSQNGASLIITRTVPTDEKMDLTRFTDADVSIEDLTTQDIETMIVADNGEYMNSTPGIPGHSYRISVNWEGKNYSSTTVMTEPVEILGAQFHWIRMPYDQVATLQVFFTDTDPESGNYFWVRIFKNNDTYSWTLTSDAGAREGVIVETIRTSRRNPDDENDKSVMKKGDVITVKVTSISQQLFDYLTAIGNDNNGLPQYDGDFCLGYFMAAPVAETSIIFDPDSIEPGS